MGNIAMQTRNDPLPLFITTRDSAAMGRLVVLLLDRLPDPLAGIVWAYAEPDGPMRLMRFIEDGLARMPPGLFYELARVNLSWFIKIGGSCIRIWTRGQSEDFGLIEISTWAPGAGQQDDYMCLGRLWNFVCTGNEESIASMLGPHADRAPALAAEIRRKVEAYVAGLPPPP